MLVLIRWIDTSFGMYDADVAPKIMERVGYLVENNERIVRIAAEREEGSQRYRLTTAIPKAVVVDVTHLRVGILEQVNE